MAKWRALAVGLAAVGTLVTATGAQAAVPTQALVEGTLGTAGGGAAADGNYGVKLALYKDAVGGAPLWTEQATLDVKGGQFQHALGSVAGLSQAVLQSAAYIGIAVASDPELPRKPLHAVLFAARSGVAEAVACSGCLSMSHLDAQLQSDIKNVVKASDLADVAKSGNYADLLGAPNLAGFAKTADLKKVATTGSYNDLTDLPALPKAGSGCGTNLVVKGLKADGSFDCAAGGGGALAADGIDEISNNLIFNTFVDSIPGKTEIPIPDFAGPGVTDTLEFPDIGIGQKIWVQMNIANSDMTSIKVELYGPNMSSPYVVYNGGKTGNSLSAKFNDDTPLVNGDMNKDWLGKNIKGLWSITVRDLKDNTPDNIDGKFSWSMNIQTLSNKKIQIKGDLIVDGTISVGGAGGYDGIKALDFKICQNNDATGPCVAKFTGNRTFLEAAKYCAAQKADICTDSQAYAARVQWTSLAALSPNWTNSFAENDGSQWSAVNGGTGDNHPADALFLTPCCFNYSPTVGGEQTHAGVRVLKVNNTADKTWAEAVAACQSVNADLCDKGQYYTLRQQGVINKTMWASDHSDNDGDVCNSSIGSVSDNPQPGEKYAYACCATNRTSLACPGGCTEMAGICVAKIVNSGSAFSTAANACSSSGTRICSIAQTAVLRSIGAVTSGGSWTASHSDNDSQQAAIGVGNAEDNPTDGQGNGYACCY